MQNLLTSLRRPHRRRLASREKGSTIILVVVIVLLLTMMGASYIQMARLDRRATRQMDTTANTDNGSIIRFIAALLSADVVDEDGDFFANNIEAYDYPWTNPTVQVDVRDFYAPASTPATLLAQQSDGGEDDDIWLAEIEPVFTPAGASDYWRHISNTRQVFLDLVNLDATSQAPSILPTQHATYAPATPTALAPGAGSRWPDSFVFQADLDTYGADADGDGINDAFWTPAPLPSQLGRSFVMAVRIVDHGAMANANVWHRMRNSGTNALDTGVAAPRWLWPGELDMQAPFSAQTSLVSAILAERNVANSGAATPTPFNNASGRVWNWLDASRMYGDVNSATDLADWVDFDNNEPAFTPSASNFKSIPASGGNETELRWRHGMNRSSDNLTADADAEIELPSGAPDAGWRAGTAETNWNTVGNAPFNTSQQDWYQLEPRHRLTTLSGAGAYGLQSLNSAAEAMSGTIDDVVDDDFPNLERWVDAPTFADQFAAIIEDWRDIDNPNADPREDIPTLTRQGNAYGMEYLPFVSEAYTQTRYNATITAPGDPLGVTWNEAGVNVNIEIVNPWPWDIPIAEVELIVGGENWGTLRDLLTPTLTRNYLLANELVVLQLNDPGGVAFTPTGTVIDVSAEPGVAWPANTIAGADESLSIELRAPVSDGSGSVLYQAFPVGNPADVKTDSLSPAPTINDGDNGYVQVHTLGTGDGLAPLTVRQIDISIDEFPRSAGGNVEPQNPVASGPLQFGTHAKGAGFDIAADGVILDSPAQGVAPAAGAEPFTIGNRGRILRAGDLLRMVIIGPRVGKTIPEVWQDGQAIPAAPDNSNSTRLSDFMLDITDSNHAAPNVMSPRGVNYTVDLLSRFSSLVPSQDNQDNDGDGERDEDGEDFVPGLININTMTREMLENSLPMENSAEFTALIDRIIAGRENPNTLEPAITQRGTFPNVQGIAKVGEILTAGFYGAGHNTLGLIDFNEYEDQAGIIPTTADGYADDREDLTMGISYLNQVLSTRSDVYTAYVLVRAYPSTDFTTEVDEFRIIATFDRSGLTDDQRTPRVVSVSVLRN